jgi:starch-binding outer membrane protein, SusD/RagB family
MTTIRRAVSRTMLGALLLGGAACSEQFLKVTNPNVIDASTVDPTSGAATLAASAQQNFATAYGWLILYSSWFTGETNVSDTFPTRNEFGFRVISDLNGSLNGDVWQPLSLAVASTKIVLDLDLPTPTTNINLARAATFRGFSILMMADNFCTATISAGPTEGGPELTTAQTLDSAVFWFSRAVDVGTANGTADGKALANAALVGRARAKLQKGDKAGAAADAALVPAGFNYDLTYTDDLSNRTRLSNRLWQYTFDRGSMSVAAAYQLNDPRVPYKAPGQHTLQPQDAVPGGFYVQQKYPAYNSSIRLASKLEADYIAAEASGDVTQQLALIAARRSANSQPVYAGAVDAASVLKELFFQRALDFYLEGKKIGDFRRNPAAVYAVAATGSDYIKPGYVAIGSDSCYPIPRAERDNNPAMTP